MIDVKRLQEAAKPATLVITPCEYGLTVYMRYSKLASSFIIGAEMMKYAMSDEALNAYLEKRIKHLVARLK